MPDSDKFFTLGSHFDVEPSASDESSLLPVFYDLDKVGYLLHVLSKVLSSLLAGCRHPFESPECYLAGNFGPDNELRDSPLGNFLVGAHVPSYESCAGIHCHVLSQPYENPSPNSGLCVVLQSVVFDISIAASVGARGFMNFQCIEISNFILVK